MNDRYDTPLEEWLAVLTELWTAVGKPVNPRRLELYQRSLAEVPLGLLELAVRRVIRENTFNVIPVPAVVWAAVRKELGYPDNVEAAIEAWVEKRWG